MENNKLYKILSLDGGGSWSYFQLLTLNELYPNKTGHQILLEFDLVIANSGGSIVLAALIANWDLNQALTLFNSKEKRDKIFHKNSFWQRYFPTNLTTSFVGPKYSSTKKREGLSEIFKDIKDLNIEEISNLSDKLPEIVICTFDAVNNREKFFRSTEQNFSANFLDIIHGSSNAPVNYFDLPAKIKTHSKTRNPNDGFTFYSWDGALGGFNNPVAAGIIEVINKGICPKNICVRSIGTGSKVMPIARQERFQKNVSKLQTRTLFRYKTGLDFFMQTVTNMAKTILFEPPDWANYVAYMLLFQDSLATEEEKLKRFVRLSPYIYAHEGCPPYISDLVNILYPLDMDLTAQKDIDQLLQCFEAWKKGDIWNQSIKYTYRNNIPSSEIGHKSFSQAIKAW